MDMMTAIFAANKAKKDLEASGQVGYRADAAVILDAKLVDINGMNGYVQEKRINLVVGETYRVSVVGNEFYSTCKKTTDPNGNECFYLGNSLFLGGEDTGETFMVCEAQVDGAWSTTVVDTTGSSVCTVTAPEIYHTIDPKYLPPSSGGGMPVVELTTVATEAGAELTESEIARFDEATANGSPFVLKCQADIESAIVDLSSVASLLTVHFSESEKMVSASIACGDLKAIVQGGTISLQF